MNAGTYIFRLVVAVMAFVIGYSTFAVISNVLFYFAPKETNYNASVEPRAVPDTPTPNIKNAYSLSGDYFLFDEALNKGFPDFDHIGIRLEDEHWNPIPPRGFVRTKRDYKFVSISITDDLVSFETESVRGISYIFSGRFDPPADDDSESGPVLRGILFKLEKGKIAAALNTSFFPEGC